jgi:beta-lactamase superfamily II metal-dependent hydrolase
MRAIIKTFESGAGDCIFLVMKDEMDNSCFHIMMDCNILTDEIKAYIRDELYKRIDVLIVTHIDSDHANGITKLMRNPDFADMQIGMILFNGFQPQTEQPQTLPQKTVEKLQTVAELLPPTVDEAFQKTNGMDAACLITELNKHPQWKAVWRQTPILAGETMPLGNNEKWGRLRVLSPTQDAMDNLLHDVKLEYAKRLSSAPPNEDFLDQDKYYELMLRLAELRKRPSFARKTNAEAITKEKLNKSAKIDAEENGVTNANKASLAFCWEGGEEVKRILLMGDAVSSQVVNELNGIENGRIWFEAVKVSHHGSKHNTSIELNTKVDSAHYFFTGGKDNEGPDIETVAKIAMKPLADGVEQRGIHYNHEKGINLWKELNKEKTIQLLNNYHILLNTDNTYEFEY